MRKFIPFIWAGAFISIALKLGDAALLSFVHHEGTDTSVRTNISTLVTLDTVFQIPSRNIGSDTALFVSGSTLVPSTIFQALEGAHGKVVTHLCIDDASNVGDECWCAIVHLSVVSERSPSGIYGEFVVFATAVYCSVVLVYDVLPFLP